MESFKVVRPEHLNHYGYLFGGFLLKWVDEISWIAASRDHPDCMFVTVGMDRMEFHRSVRQGALLRFDAQPTRRGTTSVQYEVNVYADDLETGAEEPIFSTLFARERKIDLSEQYIHSASLRYDETAQRRGFYWRIQWAWDRPKLGGEYGVRVYMDGVLSRRGWVREALAGNICRCTGYQNIVSSILDAARRMSGTGTRGDTA